MVRQAVNNSVIMAIEGISFAGKTTLSKSIETNSKQIKRIYELSEKFENGAKFPSFPIDLVQCVKNDLWFYNEECKRSNDVKCDFMHNSIIMDRSYLSALTYCFSRQATFDLGNFEDTKKIIIEGVESGKLIEPYFIYLYMNYDTYLIRKTQDLEHRKLTLGIEAVENCLVPSNEEYFIKNQISFLDSFYKKNKKHILLLDCKNSVSTNTELVTKWKNQLKPKFLNKYDYHF